MPPPAESDPRARDTAEAALRERVSGLGLTDPVVVAWNDEQRRGGPVEHDRRRVRASVLERRADLVVFFDDAGRSVGWRDDGRLGVPVKPAVDPAAVTAAVVAELGLPGRPVSVGTAFLDPLGWTIEARYRVRRGGMPRAARVWLAPDPLRVIQVLHPPEPRADEATLERTGRETALALFEGRLRRAGIDPQPPHRYVVIRSLASEPYPGGTQVRLATWRHWSDGLVELDPGTGEVRGWHLDRLADPPSPATPERARSVRRALAAVPLPDGAVFESLHRRQVAPQHWLFQARWVHHVAGILVGEDRVVADIHPATERLVGVTERWRTVAPQVPRLSAAEAAERAAAERTHRQLDDSLEPGRPAAEYVNVALDGGGREDRLAWVVPYIDAAGRVDILIDARSGVCLGFRGTR